MQSNNGITIQVNEPRSTSQTNENTVAKIKYLTERVNVLENKLVKTLKLRYDTNQYYTFEYVDDNGNVKTYSDLLNDIKTFDNVNLCIESNSQYIICSLSGYITHNYIFSCNSFDLFNIISPNNGQYPTNDINFNVNCTFIIHDTDVTDPVAPVLYKSDDRIATFLIKNNLTNTTTVTHNPGAVSTNQLPDNESINTILANFLTGDFDAYYMSMDIAQQESGQQQTDTNQIPDDEDHQPYDTNDDTFPSEHEYGGQIDTTRP